MLRNSITLMVLCTSVCLVIGVGCPDMGLPDPALSGSDADQEQNTGTPDIQDQNQQDTGDETSPGSEQAGSPIVIDAPILSGYLLVNQPAAITLQCQVSESGGVIQAVEADLTNIGGSAAQALTRGEGDLWSWTGQVTPTTAGSNTIPITARDDAGRTDTELLPINVAEPPPPSEDTNTDPGDGDGDSEDPTTAAGPQWGSFSAGSDFGGLAANRWGEVQVNAMLWPGTAGHATSVTADLNEVNGAMGVPLTKTYDGDYTTWYLETNVFPLTSGEVNVTIHASDSQGNIVTVTATAHVW